MPSSPTVIVLLPTYNEAENIAAMLKAIHENLPQAEVLVIDDNSPDGTGAIADRTAANHPWIHVAHRPGKQGLGVAYRFGYQWAIDRGFSRILQMDCDFSHNPADLPRLLELLEDYDVVVGSRRVRGGGCEGWPWYRNALSRGGSLYARLILGSPVKDLTAGFKGFRRNALAALPLDELRADGYGFQIEVTSHLVSMGQSLYEMPIRFVDRTLGKSKMSTKIMLEAVGMVWRIRSEMKQRYPGRPALRR